MPRQKSQRPTVKPFGKREKLWRCEYTEYFIGPDGQERGRHKSATWSRSTHTKGEAQSKCDALMLSLRQGGPKSDGSMTLRQFYEVFYLPIRSRKWTGNTPKTAAIVWHKHIEPKLGHRPLKEITKAEIELHLMSLADSGLGFSMVESVRVRIHSIMEEALDNDHIEKNPARKVETPPCKPPKETRSLTVEEVQALWDGTEGADYLMWRVMVLTGARTGELIAFTRDDIKPDGLLIDETIIHGVAKLPKRNKIRMAILPESLRAELGEWLDSHENRMIFPAASGGAHRSVCDEEMKRILERGRACGIPDLEFRMCRTTFASMFDGDEADRTSIMGHTSTEFTLARYRKPLQERRQESVEKLDRRLKVVPIKKKSA